MVLELGKISRPAKNNTTERCTNCERNEEKRKVIVVITMQVALLAHSSRVPGAILRFAHHHTSRPCGFLGLLGLLQCTNTLYL